MITRLDIPAAIDALQRGGVIAYPTEAVWGLGCDPFDSDAVHRLLAIKQRPVEKGLILIAASVMQLDGLVDWDALSADRHEAVTATWPGPHTWIVPASARVPAWIRGAHASVAVRVSAHPVVVALCTAFGGVLVSTSANPSSLPAPRSVDEFDPSLLMAVDGVIEGEVGVHERPTQIRDARTGEALRL